MQLTSMELSPEEDLLDGGETYKNWRLKLQGNQKEKRLISVSTPAGKQLPANN